MKEQGLITSTIILTATSFLTRTLGMVSIVYLSNTLGADGIGLYQLIMSIYMLAIVFSSAGISVAVSKLVAEALGQKHLASIPKIMRTAFLFSGVLSFVVAGLFFILSPQIATLFIQDSRATLSLKMLSFSIPFIACSSCFKGYFYATKKAAYPASSDILEQIVKLGLIVALVSTYSSISTEYAYAAIGVGITIGELTSWSYLLGLYLLNKHHYEGYASSPIPMRKLLFQLLSIALPVAVISYIACIFMSVENVLIPSGLKQFGNSRQDSMSIYGILRGMVLPILFFPSAFLTAFSTTLIPEIAKANVLQHKKRVVYTVNRVLQLTFILSVLVVNIFINYSDELGVAIYRNAEVGPMLRILALIVPFSYVEVVTDGILKGLGKQVSCLKYSIVDSVFRISTIYFLLPIKGISALIGIMIISNILTSTLNFNKLLEVTEIKLQVTNWLLKPSLCAVAGSTFSRLLINIFFRYRLDLTTKVIIGVSLTCLIYIVLLFVTECLTSNDVKWIGIRKRG